MKKFMSGFLTAFFSFLSVSLFAQITIVRVEGSQVFMDISSTQQPIQKGNSFKVILPFPLISIFPNNLHAFTTSSKSG